MSIQQYIFKGAGTKIRRKKNYRRMFFVHFVMCGNHLQMYLFFIAQVLTFLAVAAAAAFL